MIITNQKSDNIGAIASALCLIHCIATPLLFIVQSCSLTCCSTSPVWWSSIDYFFLIISFFSVYSSTQNTSKNWIKPTLWISFSCLLTVIINEKFSLFYINDNFLYIPAISLITLHLYNRKYCKCDSNKCCSNER